MEIKMGVDFNINDEVKIKLTEHGKKIRREYYTNLRIKIPKLDLDSDGYFNEQLWWVMHIFGNHICNGCEMPFEPNIKILL